MTGTRSRTRTTKKRERPLRRWLDAVDANPAVRRAVRLALIGVAGLVFVRTAWMSDDAYITLRTVDNFVNGYGLRWNVADRVQTFTHPLWLLLEAIPYFFTHEAFYTVLVLSMALAIASVALLLIRSRSSAGTIGVAVLTCLLSRAFVDYATSGLENPLTYLFLVLFLLELEDEAPDFRRMVRLSLLAGLATLNRIDTLLLFAPGLALAIYRFRDRRGFLAFAAGFAPFFAWELFATIYYGSPFPNTAAAKLSTGIGAPALIRHGLYYFANSLRWDPVTLATIAAALGVAALRRKGRDLAVAAGIILYLLYILRIGGDFMSGRFLAAPFFAGVVLLVQSDFSPLRFSRPAFAAAAILLSLIHPPPPLLTGSGFGLDQEGLVDRRGISDERRYYFSRSGMLNGVSSREKPAPAATATGRRARNSRIPLIVEGAIGFTGYSAGPSVHVLDVLGLADPLLARLPIVDRDPLYDAFLSEATGIMDPEGWRIGHFLRRVPAGYMRTLITGTNTIEDRNLARLYDRLASITRGPLWSGARLSEIVALNLGRYDALAGRSRRPAFAREDWGEVIAVRPDLAEAYFRRARNSIAEDRIEPAVADLRKAVELDPQHVTALCLLGDVCRARGETDQAVALWRQALAANPREVSPYVRLGNRYLETRELDRAIEMYKRGLEVEPRMIEGYTGIAEALGGLGRPRESLEWLRRAVRVNPRSPEVFDDLGMVYLNIGDQAEALRMYEKALALRPGGRVIAHAGIAYAHAGKPERAIALLRQALAANPANPEACFQLGLLLEAKGDRGAGLEYLRKAASLGFEPAQSALAARGAVN